MKAHGNLKLRRQFHGFFHRFGIFNGNAVIRKAYRTTSKEFLEIRQMVSIKAFGNCRCGVYMNRCFLSFFHKVANGFFIICHRFCICHADHCGKSPGCRSLCTGVDIFFVCKTRIPKMHMSIYKPRRYHKPGSINNRILGSRCYRSSQAFDDTIFRCQIS